MKAQAALTHPSAEDRSEVFNLKDYREEKIRGVLDASVHVKGCGNVRLEDLFCPFTPNAVVVIRRVDGAFIINRGAYESVR